MSEELKSGTRDSAQLYFAFFPYRVSGGWITVLRLTDASGFAIVVVPMRFGQGQWV